MAKGAKTGGRKVGTPNRDRKDLLGILSEKYPNYHPVIAIVEIAHASRNEVIRLQAHKEVAKYVCPQLKSIEVKDTISSEGIPDLSNLLDLPKEKLIELLQGYMKGKPKPLIIDDVGEDPNLPPM